jgi:Tfp pilus assembly protein PilX
MKLVLPLSVLTLALLLLGSLLSLNTKDLRMTEELIAAEQAVYLAEAGLLHAEHLLESNPAWRGPLQNVPCGSGTYSVLVTDRGGGHLTLESTGSVGSSRRTVKKSI